MSDLTFDIAEQRFNDSELVRSDFLTESQSNVDCTSDGSYPEKSQDAAVIRKNLLNSLSDDTKTLEDYFTRVAGRLQKEHLNDIERKNAAMALIGQNTSTLILFGFNNYQDRIGNFMEGDFFDV